jgi:hypothetical protein
MIKFLGGSVQFEKDMPVKWTPRYIVSEIIPGDLWLGGASCSIGSIGGSETNRRQEADSSFLLSLGGNRPAGDLTPSRLTLRRGFCQSMAHV